MDKKTLGQVQIIADSEWIAYGSLSAALAWHSSLN